MLLVLRADCLKLLAKVDLSTIPINEKSNQQKMFKNLKMLELTSAAQDDDEN